MFISISCQAKILISVFNILFLLQLYVKRHKWLTTLLCSLLASLPSSSWSHRVIWSLTLKVSSLIILKLLQRCQKRCLSQVPQWLLSVSWTIHILYSIDWAEFSFSPAGYSSEAQSSVCSGSLDAAVYQNIKGTKMHNLMTMPRTLALCYLALLWVREAVTLADLLRFERTNTAQHKLAIFFKY